MAKISVRADELCLARIAGYHEDSRLWVRTVVERRRTSYKALKDAYRIGQRLKANGTKCDCFECKRKAES